MARGVSVKWYMGGCAAAGQAHKATQDTTRSYVDAAADKAGVCMPHKCLCVSGIPTLLQLQLTHVF